VDNHYDHEKALMAHLLACGYLSSTYDAVMSDLGLRRKTAEGIFLLLDKATFNKNFYNALMFYLVINNETSERAYYLMQKAKFGVKFCQAKVEKLIEK